LGRRPAFQLVNLVAKPGRFFVRLLSNRQPQVISEFDELVAFLAVVGGPLGEFSTVMRVAVNVFEQGEQLFAKGAVAVGTAQPALTAKFSERRLAGGADEFFEGLQLGFAQSR